MGTKRAHVGTKTVHVVAKRAHRRPKRHMWERKRAHVGKKKEEIGYISEKDIHVPKDIMMLRNSNYFGRFLQTCSKCSNLMIDIFCW